MIRTLRPFFLASLFTSLALITAAIVYSRQHANGQWILSAALPAYVIEGFFYLASIFKQTRELFERLRGVRAQVLLWVSAVLPYAIFSVSAGTFQRNAFYLLAGLMAALAFWYAILPRRAAYDLGFLIVAAAPQITRVFNRIYVSPVAHSPLPMEMLGHLAWIHVGIVSLLIFRPWDPGEFTPWPNRQEWQRGLTVFLIGIIPLILMAELVHDVRFVVPHGAWWRTAGQAIGTFFGIFWVVALSEELFFRGFIQKACQQIWNNTALAIGISSLLFGAVHLWTNHFPNWQHAIVAAVLGVFCGLAYQWAGSVRASMVTHACVVVTWRLFFR